MDPKAKEWSFLSRSSCLKLNQISYQMAESHVIPKLSDCRGLPASGCVAADTRKMLFRYSQLCGTASDTVDAVISAIPKGFKF